MSETLVIEILGKPHTVKLPKQFAVKEELVVAYVESAGSTSARQRVCAAVIGICTDIGAEARADYVKARFDVLAYGGAVYGYLREKGVEMEDVPKAAAPILRELEAAAFPRKEELAERKVFSPPSSGG
jgi:hypothetical protein